MTPSSRPSQHDHSVGDIRAEGGRPSRVIDLRSSRPPPATAIASYPPHRRCAGIRARGCASPPARDRPSGQANRRRDGGPTATKLWCWGGQYTPDGAGPASGLATFTTSGNRPPAGPQLGPDGAMRALREAHRPAPCYLGEAPPPACHGERPGHSSCPLISTVPVCERRKYCPEPPRQYGSSDPGPAERVIGENASRAANLPHRLRVVSMRTPGPRSACRVTSTDTANPELGPRPASGVKTQDKSLLIVMIAATISLARATSHLRRS